MAGLSNLADLTWLYTSRSKVMNGCVRSMKKLQRRLALLNSGRVISRYDTPLFPQKKCRIQSLKIPKPVKIRESTLKFLHTYNALIHITAPIRANPEQV